MPWHLLRDPNLIERIVDDFARCGIVGEATNIWSAISPACRASWTGRWP